MENPDGSALWKVAGCDLRMHWLISFAGKSDQENAFRPSIGFVLHVSNLYSLCFLFKIRHLELSFRRKWTLFF